MFILGFLVIFMLTATLVAAINWLNLIPWRRAASAHWTERNRLVTTVRSSLVFTAIGAGSLVFLVTHIYFPDLPGYFTLNILAFWLGSTVGTYALVRELYPGLPFVIWCKNTLMTISVFYGPTIIIGLGCIFMPEQFSLVSLLIFGLVAGLHFWLCFGGAIRLSARLKFIYPAGAELQRIVAATAQKLGVNQPRHVWQAPSHIANAIAFPTTQELIFFNRAVEICTPEEIATICAHELGHLAESKRQILVRLLLSMGFLPYIFIIPLMHALGIAGMFLPFLFLVIMNRIKNSYWQRLEKQADKIGAFSQQGDGDYARALEKLYQANHSPAVNITTNSTHPHLYDRLISAGITPEYPRPAKPNAVTASFWWLLVTNLVLVFIMLRH
ncbi:MAG TPA: M48 family metalloprotease [Verrucomicrobiae bacterium]